VFRSGALQFDPTTQHNAAYQNARRRDLAARTADNYPAPGPRPRPQTRDGYPVQVRNGLPPHVSYRYRGTGQSMSPAEAAYWLTEVT
jgi:hypothetical protein